MLGISKINQSCLMQLSLCDDIKGCDFRSPLPTSSSSSLSEFRILGAHIALRPRVVSFYAILRRDWLVGVLHQRWWRFNFPSRNLHLIDLSSDDDVVPDWVWNIDWVYYLLQFRLGTRIVPIRTTQFVAVQFDVAARAEHWLVFKREQ